MSNERQTIYGLFGFVVMIVLIVATWTLDTTITYKLIGSALVIAAAGAGLARLVD